MQVAEIEARRKHSLELEKKAVEYKFLCFYRIGEMLAKSKDNGERASPKNTQFKHGTSPGVSAVKTLKQLHITPKMSSRYQEFYKKPEEERLEIVNNAMRRLERKEVLQKQKTASDIPSD